MFTRTSKHIFHYDEMKRENAGKQMKSVWRFSAPGKREKTHGKHPTQKPLELCRKLIMASRNKEGDTLLVVPFAGSGSECVAAKQENIHFIGFEINED